MKKKDSIDRCVEIAKALSEAIRVRVLLITKNGAMNLQQLVEIYDLAPSTLSKHLKILENSGLLVSKREGRWRYFSWPQSPVDDAVKKALLWINKANSDPVLTTDMARRTVAVQNSQAPPPKGTRSRVIFLCTHNSCRSQMAEALLRHHGGDRFEVYSAGIEPRKVPPLTREVMGEAGIDISHQRSKSVLKFIGNTYFDHLITVCPMAEKHTPVFPGVTERLHWPEEDPSVFQGSPDEQREMFRMVRNSLEKRIVDWIDSK